MDNIGASQIELLGVKITNISSIELNNAIFTSVNEGKLRQLVLNVNINAMNIAYKNEWFKEMLNSAFINFCDGDGVRLAARITKKVIREKITYNRWIWKFSEFCEKNQISYYLIGSKQYTVQNAVRVLSKKYPLLEVTGYHNGFFKDQHDINLCLEEINKKKPNILIIGMGMPYQEKWLLKNKEKIHFNIALAGGAVFEYISGEAPMTPNIFYKLKLEWLYRFMNEPKRLFTRYFIGNPLFIFRVLLERFKLLKI